MVDLLTLQDGSDLYLLADELSKKFEERIKAAKLDVGPARADKSIPCVWCSLCCDSRQMVRKRLTLPSLQRTGHRPWRRRFSSARTSTRCRAQTWPRS
jgi:hypothetical protein